ncbi:MAG: hypothetical protein JWO63_628 [Frankiales bacterium]|nr:hypothetical protein [Frankiales bacterium]
MLYADSSDETTLANGGETEQGSLSLAGRG